jgi:hypothetical protein
MLAERGERDRTMKVSTTTGRVAYRWLIFIGLFASASVTRGTMWFCAVILAIVVVDRKWKVRPFSSVEAGITRAAIILMLLLMFAMPGRAVEIGMLFVCFAILAELVLDVRFLKARSSM